MGERTLEQSVHGAPQRLGVDDPLDERPDSHHAGAGIGHRQVEIPRKARERFAPMLRYFKARRPVVGATVAKHGLACGSQPAVISDEFLHEQEIDQIAESIIALSWPWRKRHAVQLLSDVEAQRQARKIDRSGYAERVRERNGRQPFDLRLARFGARDIDRDGGPCAAEVTDGEFQVHGPVVQQERFTLPAKRESLIRLTAQRAFERSREIGVRVLQHHVDIFRGASPPFTVNRGCPLAAARSSAPAMTMYEIHPRTRPSLRPASRA